MASDPQEASKPIESFFWHRLVEVAEAALEKGGDPLLVEVKFHGGDRANRYYVMRISSEHAEFALPVMAESDASYLYGKKRSAPYLRYTYGKIWGPPDTIIGCKLVCKEEVVMVDILPPADRTVLASKGYTPALEEDPEE